MLARPERRRAPRVSAQDSHSACLIPVDIPVRLVELSASGVLLSAPEPLEVGARAQLRTVLGHEAFDLTVEVRRISTPGSWSDTGICRIAAEFVAMDEWQQKVVDRFLALISGADAAPV